MSFLEDEQNLFNSTERGSESYPDNNQEYEQYSDNPLNSEQGSSDFLEEEDAFNDTFNDSDYDETQLAKQQAKEAKKEAKRQAKEAKRLAREQAKEAKRQAKEAKRQAKRSSEPTLENMMAEDQSLQQFVENGYSAPLSREEVFNRYNSDQSSEEQSHGGYTEQTSDTQENSYSYNQEEQYQGNGYADEQYEEQYTTNNYQNSLFPEDFEESYNNCQEDTSQESFFQSNLGETIQPQQVQGFKPTFNNQSSRDTLVPSLPIQHKSSKLSNLFQFHKNKGVICSPLPHCTSPAFKKEDIHEDTIPIIEVDDLFLQNVLNFLYEDEEVTPPQYEEPESPITPITPIDSAELTDSSIPIIPEVPAFDPQELLKSIEDVQLGDDITPERTQEDITAEEQAMLEETEAEKQHSEATTTTSEDAPLALQPLPEISETPPQIVLNPLPTEETTNPQEEELPDSLPVEQDTEEIPINIPQLRIGNVEETPELVLGQATSGTAPTDSNITYSITALQNIADKYE